MKMLAAWALGALALAAAGSASAQAPPPGRPPGPPPPPARGPALDVALEAAQVAVATCKAHGYNVTALVIDSAGVPKAMLVGDGAPGMTTQISQRKAMTALTFKRPSGAVGEEAKTDPALAERIKSDPKLIGWAGGLPLKVGDEVIGAIGVSGAPGGDKDEACANPAVAQIQPRLK
jgi:uncharacterized protein GlcG (DUF336 family)